MNDAKAFFEALFPDLGNGFIEFRLLGLFGDVEAQFFKSVDEAVAAAAGYSKDPIDANIYFGVCPRAMRKGDKNSIRLVCSLWADLDGKDFAGGKPEALERLRGFTPRPGVIADSGYGLHAYWPLEEPIAIDGPNSSALVEQHLKALARALGADSHAAELARILRVPGTFNLKQSKALQVSVLECDPARRCRLSDFAHADPMGSQPRSVSANPPGWVAPALEELRDGNRNGTFAKVAGRLHQAGLSAREILALLAPHADASQFPMRELTAEVEGICRRYPSGVSFPDSSPKKGKPETEKPPAEVLQVSALLASGSAEIDWCVEGILPAGGVTILGAPHGHGKSWILLDLAIECSRRGSWLGHFQTAGGPVLYVDEESTPNLLRVRISKLLQAKGINPEELDLHFCAGQGISIDSEAGVERFRQVLRQVQPRLVIVDTLIRVHGADENSATDMARVFNNVKSLSREFGCAFAFADHQRKPDRFHSSADFLLRGSTEKPAFVDTLLSIRRKDKDLVVEHSKSRYGEPVDPFVVRIEDPCEGSTTVTYLGDATEAINAEKMAATHSLIDSALVSGEFVPRQDLAEAAKVAKIPVKVLDSALAEKEKAGSIEKERRSPPSGKGNKAAFYRRKPAPTVIPFPIPSLIGGETETESPEAGG